MSANGNAPEDSGRSQAAGARIVPQDGTSPEQLERLIRDTADVPVFPTAGLKLLAAFKNPYFSAKQLGEIIAGDVGMSARVLRMANSAYYGIQNKVTTVQHAVTLLGMREMEQMALSLCFMAVSSGKTQEGEEFNPGDYVRHSMVVAKVAQFLCGDIAFQLVGRGEAYAAGLLHDVGLIVLFRNHRQLLAEALRRAHDNGWGYARAEMAVLGVSHAALGAWLGQRWNLPYNLCEAIAYHHTAPPATAMQPELVALLKLAEKVADKLAASTLMETTEEEPLDAPTVHLLASRGLPEDPRALVETVLSRHAAELEKLLAEVDKLLTAAGESSPGRTVADLDRPPERRPPAPPPPPEKPESNLSRLRRWFGH